MREDWAEAKLEDMLDYIQPAKYIVDSTEYNDNYKIPVLTPGKTFILGYTNEMYNVFSDGPVIIFDDFTTATKFVNFKFKVKSSAMKILIPTSNLVNMKYVFYYMQTIRYNTDTHKRYWISIFSKLGIEIAPIPEQRAIVAKIEELFSQLDTGINNLKNAKEKLEIYRQAVLKKAFEGELTKEWREKQTDLPLADELLKQIKHERQNYYKSQLKEWEISVNQWEANGKKGKKPRKPDKIKIELILNPHESQKLDKIPLRWAWINIDFATSKLGDGLHGTPKYSDGDYYFINGNNLQNGRIVFKNDTKRISKEEVSKYYRDLNDQTVLVSINGTLGNIAFYNNEKVMLGKSACYFNLLPTINKNYIRWIIESHEFKNYAVKTATGTTIKNVPLRAMREFVFPLCSLEEQAQIIEEIETRLSVCDNILVNIEEGLEKAEALRQSILKKAFEGKLLNRKELEACRREPDWEPAKKLIDRVKKEEK